jgi:hypothetical protein
LLHALEAEDGERADAGCDGSGEKGVGFVDGVDGVETSFFVVQCRMKEGGEELAGARMHCGETPVAYQKRIRGSCS